MPYKSERCKIAGTKYDKRRKLTAEQKAEIAELIGFSSREIARMYGVSRRTVQFIQHPERLQRNKQCRANRGGWRQYYNRQEWAANMRKHRQHKHALYKAGKITPPVGILTSATPEITSATRQSPRATRQKANNHGAYQKIYKNVKKVVDIVKNLYYNVSIKGKEPNRAGGSSKEQSKGA